MAGFLSVFILTGCIGPADAWRELDPLYVSGRVCDETGQPAPGQDVRMALGERYDADGLLEEVRKVERSKTDQSIGGTHVAKTETAVSVILFRSAWDTSVAR